MQTRNQQYALDSYERVAAVAEEAPEFQSKYRAMAHELPVLIHTAGLVQALTFIQSRGDSSLDRLLDNVAHSLEMGTGADLIEQSRNLSLIPYMHLSMRTIDVLQWYKRFSQTLLSNNE